MYPGNMNTKWAYSKYGKILPELSIVSILLTQIMFTCTSRNKHLRTFIKVI